MSLQFRIFHRSGLHMRVRAEATDTLPQEPSPRPIFPRPEMMPNRVHEGNSYVQITVHLVSKEFQTLFPPRVVGKSHDSCADPSDRSTDSLPSNLPSIRCPKGSKQRFWCHPCLFKYLKFRETGHSTPTTHPNFPYIQFLFMSDCILRFFPPREVSESCFQSWGKRNPECGNPVDNVCCVVSNSVDARRPANI